MKVSRYKPFFSIEAQYEQPDSSFSKAGISIVPASVTAQLFANFHWVARPQLGKLEVYYEGLEFPIDAPISSLPIVDTIPTQYLYFHLFFTAKELLPLLKFHANTAIENAIGFPLLYKASVTGGIPSVQHENTIRVLSSLNSYTIAQSATGLSSSQASISIKDEANQEVPLASSTAFLNTKVLEANPIPEYQFSLAPRYALYGVYHIEVGTHTETVFVNNGRVMQDAVAIIRVLKNEFLNYQTSLSTENFIAFQLTIPKS